MTREKVVDLFWQIQTRFNKKEWRTGACLTWCKMRVTSLEYFIMTLASNNQTVHHGYGKFK